MNRNRLYMWAIGWLLLPALTACAGLPWGGGSGADASVAAAEQFRAERSGEGGGTDIVARVRQGIAGTVERIESDKMIVKDMMGATSRTVHFNAATEVAKQVAGEQSDIVAGVQLTAFVSEEDGVLTAASIEIGAAGDNMIAHGAGAGDTGATGAAPGKTIQRLQIGDGAAPKGDGVAAGVAVQALVGTVEQVDGTTMTLKDREGALKTVVFGADMPIFKQVAGTIADITLGTTVVVALDDGAPTVAARSIRILPGAMQVKRK